MKEVGYDQKDFHIQSTSFPFNVFENCSPVKHKFWQFMNKCHNAENVKKDVNPTFVHKKNSAKLMKISYLDETYTGEIPTDLLVGTNTNTDLSVRFKREYRNAFPDLKDVFLSSSCRTRCKILHVMKRKKIWKSSGGKCGLKTIPKGTTEKEKQPVIEVVCNKGKGKVHMYECNHIIADPDRKELLDNYEFVLDLLVCLPLVQVLSSWMDLNLPPFDRDSFPSPVFKHNGRDGWVDLQCQCGKNYWFYFALYYMKLTGTSFCHPMIWFALMYGAAPLYNQNDACHLEANGKLGWLQISSKMCASSIGHVNQLKKNIFGKICSSFENEDGYTVQNTYYSRSMAGNNMKHNKKEEKFENHFMNVNSFHEDLLKD